MHPFKVGDVIKCISQSGNVYTNQTYTVLKTRQRELDGCSLVMVSDVTCEWYKASRFVLESNTSSPKRDIVDVREERLRAMLTTTNDPFTCKKCGAPRATCTYH